MNQSYSRAVPHCLVAVAEGVNDTGDAEWIMVHLDTCGIRTVYDDTALDGVFHK
jgi:hypothetical protein